MTHRKKGFTGMKPWMKPPLAALMREQMYNNAGIEETQSMKSPNILRTVDSTIHSSMMHVVEGLPERLHGKMKYAEQIIRVQKQIKVLTIVRSVFALILVILLQL